MNTKLVWLNNGNKTGEIQKKYVELVLDKFKGEVTCLEIGCAYGGGVEAMARLVGDKGKVYGYDTFDGHPKDLSEDPRSKEATCMDYWYLPEVFGKDALDIQYQEKVLKEEGLENTKLVKGRINENSFDDIDKVHLALIDLDLIKSTRTAFEGIKDKVVDGGYILFHDTLTPDHLPEIYNFVYNDVLKEQREHWGIEEESNEGLLTVVRKR